MLLEKETNLLNVHYLIPNQNKHNNQTITSLEVADMVDKEHKNLLADIRGYISNIEEANKTIESAELKIQPSDFFILNSYRDANNQSRPCYDVTKKGCEFIANKLTGIKGTLFTARYINKFNDMENLILESEFNNNREKQLADTYLFCAKFIADDLRVNDASRIHMYRKALESINVSTDMLPDYTSNGNKEMHSATELLENNNCDLKVVAFNKLLVAHGFLEERERVSSKGKIKKYKVLTEKGLQYGENLVSDKNQKESQPYYYVNSFLELYRIVTE